MSGKLSTADVLHTEGKLSYSSCQADSDLCQQPNPLIAIVNNNVQTETSQINTNMHVLQTRNTVIAFK